MAGQQRLLFYMTKDMTKVLMEVNLPAGLVPGAERAGRLPRASAAAQSTACRPASKGKTEETEQGVGRRG